MLVSIAGGNCVFGVERMQSSTASSKAVAKEPGWCVRVAALIPEREKICEHVTAA